jgi:glycosyltransferase involved in cell wall biosynthesis
MIVGVVPFMKGRGGGIYQYSLAILKALREFEDIRSKNQFVIFTEDIYDANLVSSKGKEWVVQPLIPSSLKQRWEHLLLKVYGAKRLLEISRRLRRGSQTIRVLPNPDLVYYRQDISRWFRHFGVELMLYPAPNSLSFETGIPYIMAIHDLQHRLQPEFPEVSANGEWEWREYLFRNGARYATLLMADSEVGKQDILDFYGPYGVAPERVKILPFVPAHYLAVNVSEIEKQKVRMKYNLPERYLFYPAQFWPHKNHARIIKALDLIKQRNHIGIPIVLCGSYWGDIMELAFSEVMGLASQLGLDEEVRYVGYVPDEDMSGLYAGATALVFPTFFGPTNIPVLEAWAFGCPVITSNIRGIREQAGDAAILVDPHSVESIADGIYKVWTNDGVYRALIDKGRQRLSRYRPDDFSRRLAAIIDEAKERLVQARK